MTSFVYALCQILTPWITQNNSNKNEEHMMATKTITNKFENHLLSIKAEHQKQIRPNCHPTYNERQEKIIELIDWTLEKYKSYMDKTQREDDEEIIIDNIIEELDKQRDIAIHKKKQALLKDDVWKYGGEEDTIDYVLFRIRELTGKLI